MSVLFDSSVLAAALWAQHHRHEQANNWLAKVKQGQEQGFVSQQDIAETFISLTSLPVSPQFHPHVVRTVLGEALWQLQIISLDEADYVQLLEQATDSDSRGNVVRSLLTIRAAVKAGAEMILTVQPTMYPPSAGVRLLSV